MVHLPYVRWLSGTLRRISPVASMTSITGIRRSIRTASGLRLRANCTASSPFEASPTTSRAGSSSRNPCSSWLDYLRVVGDQDLYRHSILASQPFDGDPAPPKVPHDIRSFDRCRRPLPGLYFLQKIL